MLCSKQQTNIIFGNMFLSGLHITPFIILHVSLSFHNSICPGFVVSQWLLLNWVWGSGKGLPWYGVRSHGRRGKHESLTMNSLSSVLLSMRWMFSPLSLFLFSTSLKKPELDNVVAYISRPTSLLHRGTSCPGPRTACSTMLKFFSPSNQWLSFIGDCICHTTQD